MKMPEKANESYDDYKPRKVEPESLSDAVAGIKISDLLDLGKIKAGWLRTFQAHPVHLKKDFTHKVIISFKPGHIQMVDGPNGDKNQYIAFNGYHIQTLYTALMKEEYFVVMFPLKALINSIAKSTLRSLDWFDGQLIEMHFKKKTSYTYEILFMAKVEQKEPHHFKRVQRYYTKPRYNP